MNRKGCQCIVLLFVRKFIYPFILFVNTLVTFSDCVNIVRHSHGEKKQKKKG